MLPGAPNPGRGPSRTFHGNLLEPVGRVLFLLRLSGDIPRGRGWCGLVCRSRCSLGLLPGQPGVYTSLLTAAHLAGSGCRRPAVCENEQISGAGKQHQFIDHRKPTYKEAYFALDSLRKLQQMLVLG